MTTSAGCSDINVKSKVIRFSRGTACLRRDDYRSEHHEFTYVAAVLFRRLTNSVFRADDRKTKPNWASIYKRVRGMISSIRLFNSNVCSVGMRKFVWELIEKRNPSISMVVLYRIIIIVSWRTVDFKVTNGGRE